MVFVGRARALARLLAAVEGAAAGRAALVLVTGEAGIGKSTLIGEAATRAGLPVGWGTCRDAGRAPAFWPWSLALRALLDAVGDARSLAGDEIPELARLLPELADAGAVPADAGQADAARLRLFDATARVLERLARRRPLLLVLDDLQWADPSTLELLAFVAQPHRPVPLAVVGAYRHDELTESAARTFALLAPRAETVPLRGLDPPEVRDLVVASAGDAAAHRAADIHRRTAGHPFLVRQLAELLDDGAGADVAVPPAAKDLVRRRVGRLAPPGAAVLRAAALMGNDLLPDVLGRVCGLDAAAVAAVVDDGVQTGVLVRDGSGVRVAHDLFRETVAADLAAPERLVLHRRIADALEHRHARGGAVAPADLARHAAAAAPLTGARPAVRWARAAAASERARLAFTEAAAHLARARRAVEDLGTGDGSVLVDLLVEEADAVARSGDPRAARALLADARARAEALGDAERRGHVALGVQRLGARFAMPREDVVAALDVARAALHGTGTALEAELTAALARELQHSVPGQRHRARPLSERALALAHGLDDAPTLVACLLAHHDVLWTVGRARERIAVAREIATVAERAGDPERHAEGLLLTANALLEDGSPAFRAVLDEYLAAAGRLGQPRHRYLVRTREAALALLDGRLDEAGELIAAAAALGERIGEPDTGNVRMSQLLGLAWARQDPDELRATAREAVRWWVGVPSHAHAVAAALHVRAGDLDAGRRALDTVVSLGAWREDRSYLWSVFVGGMAAAAAALGDLPLCAELLPELAGFADSCGVNGALVCFTGSNAHWAGLLAAALGRADDARHHLAHALRVHQRLGAGVWEVETRRQLAALDPGGDHAAHADRLAAALGITAPAAAADAELRRDGDGWRVRHRDASAHLGRLKGLADLAVLLARPGRDVHVLDLIGAGPHDRGSGPALDAGAAAAYRRRLAELDEDVAVARSAHDTAREERCDAERTALLAELGRAAGFAGRPRALGGSTTERARKAVSGRLREAIQRIGTVLPELGAHLDRSVTTGTTCRYEPAEPLSWRL